MLIVRRREMKKILILILVFAMAPLAEAGFLASWNGSSIVVSNDEALLGGINIGLGVIGPDAIGDITVRTIGAPTTPPDITRWGDVRGYGMPWNDLVTIVWGDPVTTPNPAGLWLNAALSHPWTLGTEANHSLQVDLIDGNAEIISTVYLVPEPATMLIFGLGALMLRRKK